MFQKPTPRPRANLAAVISTLARNLATMLVGAERVEWDDQLPPKAHRVQFTIIPARYLVSYKRGGDTPLYIEFIPASKDAGGKPGAEPANGVELTGGDAEA